ncbi:PIN domain-containing protein [Xylanimonas sp. McL0601]|uniref:PIN domain-containing protein n=1 Tax=Xylanimonas sp. McL0601 TaxID=3414739 RepID=UPI003CF2AE52
MEIDRSIVLDANILMRAVLGRKVRQIVTEHAGHVAFYAPRVAYDDARRSPLRTKRSSVAGASPRPFAGPLTSEDAFARGRVAAPSTLVGRSPARCCPACLDCPEPGDVPEIQAN